MSDKTDAFENDVINHVFRNTSLGLDVSNVWIALCTSAPGSPGNMAATEITLAEHAEYARIALARTGPGFQAAIGGVTATALNATWAAMVSGTGGTATHVAIFKGSVIATNDAIYTRAAGTPRVFSLGKILQIDAGALTITES